MEQANRYGAYIYTLGMRRKKGVTPGELLDLARDADNPCHDYFKWDDSEAAEDYRRYQARVLLRSFVVCYESTDGGEALEDVAMHRIPVASRVESHAYVPAEKVVKDVAAQAYVTGEYTRRIRAIARDVERNERFAAEFPEHFPELMAGLRRVSDTLEKIQDAADAKAMDSAASS
jgi:hypothetical protein